MSTELTVMVPANAADLATEQSRAEELALSLSTMGAIESADEYTALDTILSEVARRKAAVLDMRKSATGPLYGVIRTVETWFRPLVTSLESCESSLKGAMGKWRVLCAEREREARELAAKAAESGDAGALVEALTVATEAAAKPDARATTRFMWVVESVDESELDRHMWMIPNYPKLESFAKSHKGDMPPEVHGVKFKRVAQIGAKK
jgi:hypothetical protein